MAKISENGMLIFLLKNEIIFSNSHWWEKSWPEEAKKSIGLYVNCSDVFAWACSEAEGLYYEELKDLYDHCKKDSAFGSAVWCIKRRKASPQKPVYDAIMKAGIWNLDEILGVNNG
jgi:hypothetical protein